MIDITTDFEKTVLKHGRLVILHDVIESVDLKNLLDLEKNDILYIKNIDNMQHMFLLSLLKSDYSIKDYRIVYSKTIPLISYIFSLREFCIVSVVVLKKLDVDSEGLALLKYKINDKVSAEMLFPVHGIAGMIIIPYFENDDFVALEDGQEIRNGSFMFCNNDVPVDLNAFISGSNSLSNIVILPICRTNSVIFKKKSYIDLHDIKIDARKQNISHGDKVSNNEFLFFKSKILL